MAQPLMQKRMEDEAKQFQTMQKGASAPDPRARPWQLRASARECALRNRHKNCRLHQYMLLLALCSPGRRVVRASC